MNPTQTLTKPRQSAISPVLAPLQNYLLANRQIISATLPERVRSVINAPMIVAMCLVECSRAPKLLGCTPESLLRSILIAAEMGLRPGAAFGEAYLIPYGNECQLQVGYRGLQRLAVESRAIDDLTAEVVYAKELAGRFSLTYSPPDVQHAPILTGDKGEVVGAWAWGRLGGKGVGAPEWMDIETLGKIRAQAESKGVSPAWKGWPGEMQRKSVTKRYLKRVPAPLDALNLQRAITADNRAETGQGQNDLLEIPAMTDEARAAADALQEVQVQHGTAVRQENKADALDAMAGEMTDEEKAAALAAERAEAGGRRGR